MQNEIIVWLEDISNAIAEIELFLPEPRDFSTFVQDIKTKRALERNIEIIGEAMGRILNVMPDLQITSARRIVDTRNRIIHGYDSVSDEIIWLIVVKYLPVLKTEIQSLRHHS